LSGSNSNDMNTKSRFVDSMASGVGNQMNGNSNYNNDNNLNNQDYNQQLQQNQQQQQQQQFSGSMNNKQIVSSQRGIENNGMVRGDEDLDQLRQENENSQMFDKILSEVIHVTGLEQRNQHTEIGNDSLQDMTFKFNGILESSKQQQQLKLPVGIPAPLSVLAAQPPFQSDINFINQIAHEADQCINGFKLNIPDNVAFDFSSEN
jgi:hypothetical protein